MSASRPGLLLPVVLTMVAAVPLCLGGWMGWRIHTVSRWPKAEARVLSYGASSPTVPVLDRFDRPYQPHLEYVFQVDGRAWGGRKALLFPGWFSEAEAVHVARHGGSRMLIPVPGKPGEPVTRAWSGVVIRYNPANPEESVAVVNGGKVAAGMAAVGT